MRVVGNGCEAAPVARVEPVDAKEVERMRRVGVDAPQLLVDRFRDRVGTRELGERRQHGAGAPEPLEVPLAHAGIDDSVRQWKVRHQ
jgi:hypothetical protein